jgi:hypothetical protein
MQAPAPLIPLCCGLQTTTVTVRSVTGRYLAVLMSRDGGASWQKQGILDPFAIQQFWRASGDLVRVVDNYTGEDVTQTVTTHGGFPLIIV